jgi:hypothetical protein
MAVDPNSLNDPAKLRVLASNAKTRGREDIWFQALARIADLSGQNSDPGVDRDFWQAITAAEEFRSAEVGKTIRLARTRQKIGRVGIMQTVVDLASKPGVSEGFRILVRGGRSDLTAESIVVRHAHLFNPYVIQAAQAKLDAIADGES